MNKRIYKKQQRRLIGRALSLIYGSTRRKDLAFLYRVRPAYFRYFDKQRLRKVWKQIQKDSIDGKYLPDIQTFIWYKHFMTWYEYFMYGYDTLKKEEKNREGIFKGLPATSWVINFDWNRGEI
jgi:hypothetical protein